MKPIPLSHTQKWKPIPPLLPERQPSITFSDMPLDLKYQIIESCDAVSFLSLSKTCKLFHEALTCQYGKTIYLKLLMRGMCKQSWLIYKIQKIREKQRKWEEEQERERQFLYRHLLAPGADVFFDQMLPEKIFPAREILRNYKISAECPVALSKELYKIQETAQYFTKLFRSSSFDISEPQVWLNKERNLWDPALPPLSVLSDEDLDEAFYEFWLVLMLFKHPCLVRRWRLYLEGDDRIWLSECKAIFGYKITYDKAKEMKLTTIRIFVEKLVRDFVSSCHEFAHSKSPCSGLLDIDTGPFYITPHSNCLYLPCSQDMENYHLYIKAFMLRYSLPGIMLFLKDEISSGYHTLKHDAETFLEDERRKGRGAQWEHLTRS
ncbi:hypothetical protein TWF970_006807 [Orbilia oligospora]|uniref:F-box domain-containing protein n=1 Tax=Orbilia oligospora TaxID=2813651 RepID=A0A7C8VBN9_ORBOL|nr:hypothetical protein TWF970_006807 [Orbilia oligospora]